MARLLGEYKELDSNEKLIQKTPNICEVYSKTGLGFLAKLAGKKPDITFSKLYLTNKKLYFLNTFVGKIKELKGGKAHISGFELSWLELPLQSITKVETPSKFSISGWLVDALTKTKGEERGELILNITGLEQARKVSIILENRDVWASSLESCILERRSKYAKESGLPPVDEDGLHICEICGTHYKPDKVKMVKCDKCGKWACREKLVGGVFSTKWSETECFDDKEGKCRHCAVD